MQRTRVSPNSLCLTRSTGPDDPRNDDDDAGIGFGIDTHLPSSQPTGGISGPPT